MNADEARSIPESNAPVRGSRVPLVLTAALVLGGGIFGWFSWNAQSEELARARGALELQVLASRLGAAAIQAEYDNYEDASRVVTGVFDGVVNYGIEHGTLPENYARLLRSRDAVVVALAQRDEGVKNRLVELFFLLQLPGETELDSRYIILATDSGRGIAPPARGQPRPSDGGSIAESDTVASPAIADTLRTPTVAKPDTTGQQTSSRLQP